MPDSDGGKLLVNAYLDAEIQEKLEDLREAQAQLDSAVQFAAERRDAANALVARIQSLDSEVHGRVRAVYLNGQSADRGTLSIGNDALCFSGWHGSISIPLKKILGIYSGTSRLAPRAGVPIVERLLPGRPRVRDTLLLTVWGSDDVSLRQLVAVADLPDGEGLASQIATHQSRLTRLEADRAALAGELDRAQSAWGRARSEVAAARTAVQAAESELRELRAQQKLQRRSQQAGGQ